MKKVLIIRFSSIGDIVLTTPVVRCIKQQIPGIQVHYLTKQQFRPVIEGNPYIDKIICIEKDKDVGGVMKELRAEKYDYIVDLHKNLRSWRVILFLLKPFGTFTKLNIRKWMICKLKINILPDVHIVDRYFHAVKRLGVKNDGLGLDYFIPTGTDPWEKLPALPHTGYLTLVIGGKHATKQLPKERLLELCNLISKSIVILGGPEDREAGEYLAGGSRQSAGSSRQEAVSSRQEAGSGRQFVDKVGAQTGSEKSIIINTCGQLTLNESAALVRDADRVITHDTGLMHIAAAFQKDIISIWGNTIPEFGMYPYFPKDHSGTSRIIEVKGLSCRPCSKIGYQQCPKGHFKCMLDIDFAEIQ